MSPADFSRPSMVYLFAGLMMICVLVCVWRHLKTAQALHKIWQQRAQQKQALLLQAQAHARLVDDVVIAMRQPMQGVLELNLAMRSRADLSPDVHVYLKHAHDAVVHLQTVVNDLLDPVHNELGDDMLSLRVVWEPCEVRRVVKEAFDLFESRCRHLGLAYLCQIDDDAPEFLITDAQRLRQVLINLLGNAVKFTHTGQICLRVMANPQHVQFAVEDTGIGIADVQQAVIFERFTQADETIHDHYGGHGLGLSISRQVVSQLGGSLGVVSVLGQGSRFWFDLPLDPTISTD